MTNTVLIVGNLGADPVTREAANDTQVATLSVGTSRPKRDTDGKTFKDESGFTARDTEWHRVTCFNGLAKTVSDHASKGMLVLVRGRLHYTRWTDKDGIERYGCEIIAEDVQFLSRAARSSAANA
jgi:single-strand DNA-binding protein